MPRWALPVAGLLLLLILASAAYVVYRALQGTPLRSTSGAGYTASYPSAWSVNPPLKSPTDVVLLVRDPNPAGPFDSGLILRRTTNDPYPLDHDLPSLLLANQFQYPGIRILRKTHISIHGAQDAVLVVSEVQIQGETERIVDIAAVTPSTVAFHLQAIASPSILNDSTIDAMVAGLKVSG
jgi:hypothetical protein